MGPRVWRLVLAGALICAVLGAGARSGATPDRTDRLESTALVLSQLAIPVDAALAPVRPGHTPTLLTAGRSSWSEFRDRAASDGFAVPATAAIACLAIALAVYVRLDVAPTARLGLARRRGPPTSCSFGRS